jgi:hypothetical protein
VAELSLEKQILEGYGGEKLLSYEQRKGAVEQARRKYGVGERETNGVPRGQLRTRSATFTKFTTFTAFLKRLGMLVVPLESSTCPYKYLILAEIVTSFARGAFKFHLEPHRPCMRGTWLNAAQNHSPEHTCCRESSSIGDTAPG